MSTIQLARVLLNRATRVACFWIRLSVSWRFMASVRVVVSIFLRPSEDDWNPGIVTSLHPVKAKWKMEQQICSEFYSSTSNTGRQSEVTSHWSIFTPYCWWLKSCTSWYGKYPVIYRVLYIVDLWKWSASSYQVRLKGGKEAFTWREIKEGMTGKGLLMDGMAGSWRAKTVGFSPGAPK